jgi:hypothetical protein
MTELTKPPAGLRVAGKRMWDEIVTEFIPSPGELEILRQAAHTCDEVDRLEKELRKQPFMVEGYNGQPRPNPLFKVLQEHRTLLRRLVDSLNIPESPAEEVGMTARQRHAQNAARARWAREVS